MVNPLRIPAEVFPIKPAISHKLWDCIQKAISEPRTEFVRNRSASGNSASALLGLEKNESTQVEAISSPAGVVGEDIGEQASAVTPHVPPLGLKPSVGMTILFVRVVTRSFRLEACGSQLFYPAACLGRMSYC